MLVKAIFRNNLKNLKIELFLFVSLFVFALSLIPLGIYSGGNRALILLPFLSLISAITLKKMLVKWRKITIGIIIIMFAIQLFETCSWVYMKLAKSSQESASDWIVKNIPANSNIGLENIPIYQSLPDFLLKDFYEKQYGIREYSRYKYSIINSKSVALPYIIVITNSDLTNFEKKSEKKNLVTRLISEQYVEKVKFYPDFTFYKFFGTEMDYLFNSIVASPGNISVFIK